MAILIPDSTKVWNGVTVKEYLLTKHNPNKIAMPTASLPNPIKGVTIHNTESINVASNTTAAEQYTRATVNGAMNTVRVHFYVDDTCAWQCLPLTLSGWHAADGDGNGNRGTIAMEVIGNSQKAEENAVKLAAYLLKERNLNVDNNLFTHTYWLNVRDGKKGTIDELNVMKHSYKYCPCYILPHWNKFKESVRTNIGGTSQSTKNETTNEPTKLYRIRKTWADAKSQIGAYTSLTNAKNNCKEGYYVFDDGGNIVYPTQTTQTTQQSTVHKDQIDVTYKVYTDGKWLPEVKNLEDYAGYDCHSIKYIMAKTSKGTLSYRVHLLNGGWLGWVNGYNERDRINGYAGFSQEFVDGVEMKLDLDGYDVKYRVSNTTSKEYYPWVLGSDKDYAGVIGKKIDKLQITIVSK